MFFKGLPQAKTAFQSPKLKGYTIRHLPKRLFRGTLLLGSMLMAFSVLTARIFTNNEGKTIDAEIVSMVDGQVTFKRALDNQIFMLPISDFSVKDRKFIDAELKAGRLTATSYTKPTDKTVVPVLKDKRHFEISQEIDRLLAEYWKQTAVEPAVITDDPTYLRRTYLKIIGRIPTHAEAVHFLDSSDPHKRTKLVDKLLDSRGYVSHNFNLWADILRARSTGRDGGYHGGVYYVPWIKDQIRENVPYNQFVASLLTAEGYPWENPAVAYYLRDFGMPLDNMSMTAQIFLGTQLQCAQCHNHPTDVWTQKDFYELSAFTYGLKTGLKYEDADPELRKMLTQLRRGSEGANDQKKIIQKSARDFFAPYRFGVKNTALPLKLPEDYQYDDAAPGDVVEPAILFGELNETDLHDPDSRIKSYADWMISANNLRFTKVIANRMWKHAMGKGLIEPVDNLTEQSVADVPELMTYLEDVMRLVDYDLKQYLRILYNTDYFQREAVIDNPDLDDDYHLEGPVFQRMSAEQIWDSIATLMTPDIDSILRDTYVTRQNRTVYDSSKPPAAVTIVENFSREEIIDYIKELSAVEADYNEARTHFLKMRGDPDLQGTAEYRQARLEFNQMRTSYNEAFNPDIDPDEIRGMSMEAFSMKSEEVEAEKKSVPMDKWLRNIRRASELNSPERTGHLLEIFGQSDRMLIENSETSGNVIQALFLMNSAQTNNLMAKRSTPVLEARLAKTPEAKLDALYIGFLSRKPTPAEQKVLLPYFMENPEKASERIIWAMLNTQQFLFIQ